MPVNVAALPKTGVNMYLFCGEGRKHEPLGPVKIGITGNVQARLSAVQTGSHRRLIVLAVFNMPNREIARKFEVAFHQLYVQKRLEGEWFDLDPIEALADACSSIKGYFESGERFRSPDDFTAADLCDFIGIPLFERDVKALRAWREYYGENSNVRSLAQG